MWPFTNHKMDKPKVSVIYGQRPVVKKTDPQEKFRSYQQSWREHRIPAFGNADRALKWAIRDKMITKEIPHKKSQTMLQNSYVVPTAKERMRLRWDVRVSLLQGTKPGTTKTVSNKSHSLNSLFDERSGAAVGLSNKTAGTHSAVKSVSFWDSESLELL